MIRERIKELEFQNAVELLASVARLVPKEEFARNPKAQAALDLEWNKLLKKGTWDESRVKECREICKEARDRNEKVHLGRIFETCYEKGSELPEGDLMRKFKGRTVFQGNNVRDEDGMQALFAELGSSPTSMEAAKLLDAFGSQPASLNSRPTPSRRTCSVSSKASQHGCHCRVTVGQSIGNRSTITLWYPWFLPFMGIPILAAYGKRISTRS